MALNINDPETERLAAEAAALTGDTKTGAVRPTLAGSGCLEYLIEMPFQKLALRPVGAVVGQIDDPPSPRIELFAVPEFLAQPGADDQSITGIDSNVSLIEQGMDVGSEQESVVEAVLTARGDGPDVSSLENGRYVRPADRAATMVRTENDGLEGSLTKPVGGEARIAKHRPGPVPRFAEVNLHRSSENQVQEFLEIRGNGLISEIVALALDDVASE